MNSHTKRVVRIIEQSFRNANAVAIVWSPYEADAQLVQLAVDGRVKATIITEDSVFCGPAIGKLWTGTCFVKT
jgi:hypothetical protein